MYFEALDENRKILIDRKIFQVKEENVGKISEAEKYLFVLVKRKR